MTKTVSEYADQIMALIDSDIAEGQLPHGKRIPADADSFSMLHDYVDANTYLIDVISPDYPAPEHYGDEAADGSKLGEQAQAIVDAENEMMNKVSDEVDRRLAARAPAIRVRMAEAVLFAVLQAGWPGTHGELAGTDDLNDDPADFEVDDYDVDGAIDWLLNGRPTLDTVEDVEFCGCTNTALEAGRTCGQPQCPNAPQTGRATRTGTYLTETGVESGTVSFAPAEVRAQDARNFPHDEDCPRCGRRQWGLGPDVADPMNPSDAEQETCGACGYRFQESDLDRGTDDDGPVTVNGWIYLPRDTMWQGKVSADRWLLIPAGLEAPPTMTPAQMLAQWSEDL